MQYSSRKSSSPSNSSNESRALSKGLNLMERLVKDKLPMSLAELAATIELGKPSTLRLLRTLESMGYVARNGNERYQVEVPWPALTLQITPRRLRTSARPVLDSLNTEFGETVALAILFDDFIRVIDVVESPHHIRMSNYPGRILQPYASSLGKAIAAFQEPERQQKLLDVYGLYPFTGNTIVGLGAIRDEFASVKEQGYALDMEETVEGGVCFGAPVIAPRAGACASLSVSMPKIRCDTSKHERVIDAVRRAALRISKGLEKE